MVCIPLNQYELHFYQYLVEEFNDFIIKTELVDIPIIGGVFT